MSFTDWKLPSILFNPKVQLSLTAVTASLTTAAFILASQNRTRKIQNGPRKKPGKKFEEVPDKLRTDRRTSSEAKKALTHEELSLLREQFSKNVEFFGQEGQEKLRKSFVIVVGAGGVGSWAALMLLRSGVEHMRIIDFDQVTLSSLNRHAVATRADVGTPKVMALKKHFMEILPHADIDARVELFRDELADILLEGKPDFVLDCIDNIDTKLHLLKYCHEKDIPVISSMGAGAKADPSKVQISDISETFEDSLARAVRKKIRKLGVEKGITVVYSTEKPGEVKLLPLEQSQEEKPDEFAVLPDFRVRILPVLGTLPAIFGMTMASYVVCKLADHEIQPLAIKQRDSVYARILRDLLARETKNYKIKIAGLPFNKRDIGYLIEEVWRGRSVISGEMDKLALSRWDNSKPLSFQNCICLTKAEAKAHEKIESHPEEHYPKEIVELIQLRLKEESDLSQWR